MKKNLIPVLLILALAAGCTGKSGNGTTDTTTGKNAPAGYMYKNTMAQTTIMPAAADNSSNMNVTLAATSQGNNGNAVVISAYFIGTANQTVTVSGAAGVGPFTSNQLKVWNSGKILPTSAIQAITIIAADAPNNYNLVSTAPGKARTPNAYGVNASIYSNGNGDTAIVIVQDTAIYTP